MLAWLKKKPKFTPQGQFPPEVTRAIHTMTDDLGGKQKTEMSSNEPLVAFQPGQTSGGAPFYAAPEIRESVGAPENLPVPTASPESSPFLSDVSSVPPVETPVPSLEAPADEETVLINQMRDLDAAIAPLNAPKEAPVEVSQEEQPSLSWREKFQQYKKWLFLALSIGVFIIVGLMVWYWWQSKESAPEPVVKEGMVKEIAPKIEIKVIEEPVAVTPHYSATQPNLLSFDTETVTTEEITTEFLKVALSLKQDGLRGPIEFLVRDQNYNPLAFSRFAYLLGLNLDPALLNTLDENFSLFFYLEEGKSRMGLEVTIKHKELFTEALKTGEATLPKTLEPFFLDKTTAPKTGLVFRSGVYQDQSVRYVNIDPILNLSVDFAIRENIWFIGTSQSTLRALLDRQGE